MKHQATTLVTPNALSNVEPKQERTKTNDEVPTSDPVHRLGSQEDPAFRKKLYDFIIHSLEGQRDSSPEDKVLINTALCLKGGSDWKDVIRQYWQKH